MLWKEIKTWAKSKGYETVKDKEDNQYYWAKLDSNDPTASGVAGSVSKLATAIFNHMTNNKWVEHQNSYKQQKEAEDKQITLTNYGT